MSTGRITAVATALMASLLLAAMPLLAAGATRAVPLVADHGVVASAHPLASAAGVEMLQAGGNAVDAAVAAAFVVGVVEPNASGIGGEGMMVLYRADSHTASAIDYRSTAPETARFEGRVPATGHRAVAVPGTVAGLSLALQRYGTMSLSRVLEPAIRAAEHGVVVSSTLNGAIAEHFGEIMENEPLASFLCPGGLPPEPGTVIVNLALAGTLRKLAAGGADVFYRGEIAEAIVKEVEANGGFLSRSDLASYRAVLRPPVEGSYRGYRVLSGPPPVGGLAVIEILQILDRFKLSAQPPLSARNVHLMAEAMKRGSADYREYLGDPGFVAIPVRDLLSRRYARQRAREIDVRSISAQILPGDFADHSSPSTTSLAVADQRGNLVTLTQTISDFFGAGVMVAGTGIILNNEMKNFSRRGVNAMAPGKRMRTTIAPTILLRRGKPIAALGTPGGARITSTTVLLITNLLDFKMSLQEAIEAPRFFARDTEEHLYVEERMPPETLQALGGLGYSIEVLGGYDLFFGGAQAVAVDPRNGRLTGAADPRRDGAVAGY